MEVSAEFSSDNRCTLASHMPSGKSEAAVLYPGYPLKSSFFFCVLFSFGLEVIIESLTLYQSPHSLPVITNLFNKVSCRLKTL